MAKTTIALKQIPVEGQELLLGLAILRANLHQVQHAVERDEYALGMLSA
jgi:hypothetical protein